MLITIIDPDTELTKSMAKRLRDQGYLVYTESTLSGGVNAIFTHDPHVAFICGDLGDYAKMLLEMVNPRKTKTVVMMHETSTIKDVVPDYLLLKPFEDIEVDRILKDTFNSIDSRDYLR